MHGTLGNLSPEECEHVYEQELVNVHNQTKELSIILTYIQSHIFTLITIMKSSAQNGLFIHTLTKFI